MSLQVQPPNFISQLRIAQVQNPHLTNNNPAISINMPGLTPDSPNGHGFFSGYDYTGTNGVPMHMPAFGGQKFVTPLARPLPMPPLYTFNKLPRL